MFLASVQMHCQFEVATEEHPQRVLGINDAERRDTAKRDTKSPGDFVQYFMGLG
ncbi:hypothetical protein PJL18_04098 [Paenarthrobacter nicotinovorans]|nr:hypothetical protein [Paenarthrobacter nicotinovorans]